VASALGAILVYFGTVGTAAGQLVGELILGGVPPRFADASAADEVLANLSRTTVALGTIIIVAVALFRGRRRLGVAAFTVILGANLTTQLLKEVVLDRPNLTSGLIYSLPNSFPSGHVTAAASIAVAALIVAPPLVRLPAVLVSAALVAIVGVSTLVTGWHRAGDAVGGTLVATSWAAGALAVLAWRRGIEGVSARRSRIARFGVRAAVVIGAGLLAVGVIAYLLVAFDPLGVLRYLVQRGGSQALFVVGIMIIAGTALSAIGALGLALRDVQFDPRSLEGATKPAPKETVTDAPVR
jgi:membrane-associated phospholipid phosphatase